MLGFQDRKFWFKGLQYTITQETFTEIAKTEDLSPSRRAKLEKAVQDSTKNVIKTLRELTTWPNLISLLPVTSSDAPCAKDTKIVGETFNSELQEFVEELENEGSIASSIGKVALRQMEKSSQLKKDQKDHPVLSDPNEEPFPLVSLSIFDERGDFNCSCDTNSQLQTRLSAQDEDALWRSWQLLRRPSWSPSCSLDLQDILRPFLNDSDTEIQLGGTLEEDEAALNIILNDVCTEEQLERSNRLRIQGPLSAQRQQQVQQRLAIRLATRAAVIKVKQSVEVNPDKNYLELYVNLISAEVDRSLQHVRKWSQCLADSWRTFQTQVT